MTTTLIEEGPMAAYREQAITLVNDIATALADMGDEASADRKRLRDVAQDLTEMFFMVAVIGEFNAGKSTFVNAMLGDRLLPTGITPTTEYIELIRYNEQPQRVPVVREDGLREWAHPNTGAEGVAIVDTPGTGSVFARHEKIAKDFLHRSDLVIFVISAKRAFAETERMYLELAKNYGKKIILVVNQVD
ncbi:MAG: dynamin family protein, partial [Anaerolineae bacterium]|nr:dynamin family protein [Anaerolineae bacterium]